MEKYGTELCFGGVTVGRGDAHDAAVYSRMLCECGGNPHEVLDRYMYFSRSVQEALEKACEVYDKQKG